MKKTVTINQIVAFLYVCNSIFVFTMPDKYLGIADYYFFYLMIILLGIFNNLQNPFCISKAQIHTVILIIMLTIPTLLGIINGGLESGYLLSYVLYYIVIFISLSFNFELNDLSIIIKGYIIAGVVISLIVAIQRVDYYDGSGYRYTIQLFGHDKFDPNFIGAYLVVPMLLSFSKYLYNRQKKYIACILATGMGILMSSSRGALISSIFGIVIIFWGSLKGKKKFSTMIKFLGIGIVVVIAAIYLLPQGNFNRLFVYSYYDSSNVKRIMNWESGIEAFKKSPLFGYGLLGEMNIVRMSTGTSVISHNTYIALLLQFGLIGTCVMGWYLFSLIYKAFKGKEYLLVAILFSTLMACFLVSGEVTQFLWYPIILCLCIRKYCDQNGEVSIELLLRG